jgi:hypothetical protein
MAIYSYDRGSIPGDGVFFLFAFICILHLSAIQFSNQFETNAVSLG